MAAIIKTYCKCWILNQSFILTFLIPKIKKAVD